MLRYTYNPILSNHDCLAIWQNSGIFQDENICLSAAGGRSACQGDSGGPFTVVDGGNTLQVGVFSFISVYGCTFGTPSGYVRVTHFLDWILYVMTLQ